MKIFKTWQKWLDYYHNKYGDFKIQSWTDKPKPWVKYGTKEAKEYIKINKEINHREIFPDEVFIDLDAGDTPKEVLNERLNEIGDKITRKLKSYNISYTYWSSGGNGRHITVRFPELLNYPKYQQDIIKRLFKLFLRDFTTPEGYPHICQGNPTLIQLEMARHRKGGKKTLIDFYNTRRVNIIPQEILLEFQNKKYKYKKTKNYLQHDIPEQIKFIENGDFYNVKDGRVRAAFVLIAYYSHFLEDQELFKKIQIWNEARLNNHLSRRQIWATIRSVKAKKNRPLFPHRYLNNLLEELGFDSEKLQ